MRARHIAAIFAFALVATPAAAGPLDKRIYPAPTSPLSLDGLPATAGLIDVTTADTLHLAGIAVPARGKPVLLVFHGNGSSAADSVRWFAPLIAQGFGIVAAEYRGYSANPGRPDERGLAADADAFFAYAQTIAKDAPIWVVGHSLGAGVAFGLAGRQHLAALITIGAFSRLRAAAPKIARAMIPDAYRNIDAVAALDEPWFQVQGTADEVVPAGDAILLYRAAASAKRDGAAFVVRGGEHHPSGDTLAAIFAVIAGRLAGGNYDPAPLPKEVQLFPFGASAPINP